MSLYMHQTHVKLPVLQFRLADIKQKELSGLKMLLILSCWIIAGITAEVTPTRHYRVKNSSFCIEAGKSPGTIDLMWTFNEDVIVLNKEVTANFTNKVDYNPSKRSLCINKLNETDSGTYKVSLINNGRASGETHILSVQETVPTPVIRMSVMRSNSSDVLCNITVNCTVRDGWIWFICNPDSCKTSQTSLGKVNITISVVNRSIVCISNNDVSRRTVSKSIETMCYSGQPDTDEVKTSHVVILVVIVVIIVVGFLLIAIILCVAKMDLSTKCNQLQAQTSLASLVQTQQVEIQPASLPRVSTSSEVSYENVSAMQPSSPTVSPREELEPKQSQEVDTVYSFLQVPNKGASPGKSDSNKEHSKTTEASTSSSVAQSQAEQPAEIDTVYSVLQKPQI